MARYRRGLPNFIVEKRHITVASTISWLGAVGEQRYLVKEARTENQPQGNGTVRLKSSKAPLFDG